jgi:Mobilization protein NikA
MNEPQHAVREPAPASDAPDVIYLPPPRPRRRGGVRRPAANPATAFIKLRIPPAEKAVIKAEAKRAGMTVTDYLLRHSPDRRRATKLTAIADPVLLARLLGELGKIGSNHNQLAHAYNLTGETPGREAWERQDRAIQEIRSALLTALGRAD